MKKFYSSGIPYLDNLSEGILLGDNVVWVLEPGTYFDYFLECFLTVKDKDPFHNIYVSFNFPPQKIHTRYKDFFQNDDFILVDAFTFGKGKGDTFFQSFYESEPVKSKSVRVHCVKDLSDPNEFIGLIGDLENEFKDGRLCKYAFDSLTGMQEIWGEKDTLNFFTYTCPKLFELKSLAYWPLAKDAHSKAFLANISHITQLVIRLGSEEDSTCTAEFLKMDGRPSQLLQGAHYYTFQDNTITFLEGHELPRQFNANLSPYQGRAAEKVPAFLRNTDRIKIGGQIRNFRREENLSQVELARALKVTPSALSQIENDQSTPSLPLFVEIARYFGKPLDSFFVNAPSTSQPRRRKKK